MLGRRIGRRDLLAGGAALGASVGCGHGGEWRNAIGNVRVTPVERAQPDSARELSELVRHAEATRRRIRMTGSGHSFSEAAVTRDLLLSPECLDQPLGVDAARLRTDLPKRPGRRLLRVQSGTRIREINEFAWDRGLSVQNLGGFDIQTIVGAAMTGTHGSGIDYGPIASQIVSMQVVASGGRVLQIEPSRGITDANRFPGFLEEDERLGVELIQNDDDFHSLAVSIGCMGIVYSVTLEVEPRFWLRERRTVTTWNALTKPGGFLRKLIDTGEAPVTGGSARPDYYELLFSPYPIKKEGVWEHTCLLTERYKIHDPPRARSAKARQRGAWYTDIGAAIGVLGDRILADVFEKHPEEAPKFHQTSMIGLADDEYVNRGYRVFNLGIANYARAIGVELAFDLAQTEEAFARACGRAAEERVHGRVHSVPIALRFVAPAESYLAMQYGRPTTMMEINLLADLSYADSMLLGYEHMFMAELGARPHWGLDLGAIRDTGTIAAMYPKWPAWRSAYARLNSSGVFDGAFTDRIGLSSPEW